MTDQSAPTPEELAQMMLQESGVKSVFPVVRNPVNPMDVLHRIVTDNERRQQSFLEPNLDRKREDPRTKKRKKISAQSRKRNRRK